MSQLSIAIRSATRSLDHARQRIALDILRVAATGESIGSEIRRSTQLHDAFCNLVGMAQFLVRVIEELLGHALRMYSTRHEVMTPIAQNTHEFRRKGGIEKLEHRITVGCIAGGDRAIIQVLACALAQRADVGK